MTASNDATPALVACTLGALTLWYYCIVDEELNRAAKNNVGDDCEGGGARLRRPPSPEPRARCSGTSLFSRRSSA